MAHPPSLLDTDILSELFKKNPKVLAKASEYISTHGCLNISHITKYEILKGLKAKKAEKQTELFNRFCAINNVLSITDDVVVKAADIYASLKEKGSIISDADILVAAVAISNNLVLVTNNTNHFSKIESLQLSNWKI